MKTTLLLDIILKDRFYCQLKYDRRGFPLMLESGETIESIDYRELERFVEEKRPSLIGKDYHIEFADQRV